MSMDGPCVISIEGIEVFAHHGVLPLERERGQRFLIDVRMELSSVPGEDDLESTVDYAEVASRVADLATVTRYDLIETLASHIGSSLLDYGRVRAISVTVKKPEAPMPVPVECVGVTILCRRPPGDEGSTQGGDA